jgi:large subunit ribosomal protein L17
MRHLKRGRKLNRTPTHRRAMLRNLVTSLFRHGRVMTTPAKAKEARPFAERLVTLAKDGSLHARRRAIALLHDKHIVSELFSEIGPRYKDRPGGYCRILRSPRHRIGDGAPLALFELVEAEMKPKKKRKKTTATVARVEPEAKAEPKAPAADEPAAGETAAGEEEPSGEENGEAKEQG